MSMNDTLADVLSRIRNGQNATLREIRCPYSKLSAAVVEVLKQEGYISDHAKEEQEDGKADLLIRLKYHEGLPVIKQLKRVSTPGRRVYKSCKDMPRYYNGLGIAIVSTSSGVMSDYHARKNGVGGEILCSVF